MASLEQANIDMQNAIRQSIVPSVGVFYAQSRIKPDGGVWGEWETMSSHKSLSKLKEECGSMGIPKGFKCQVRYLKVVLAK